MSSMPFTSLLRAFKLFAGKTVVSGNAIILATNPAAVALEVVHVDHAAATRIALAIASEA